MDISIQNLINLIIEFPALLIIFILISIIMFINGLSDAPNSIATCVSTRSMTPKKALIFASIFNFLGVVIMCVINMKVAETVFKIVTFGGDVKNNTITMIGALVSIIIWTSLTWYIKIPSSQSHALLAGLSGAVIALRNDILGINTDQWKKVLIGLVVINLLSFVLGFIVTRIIEKLFKNIDRMKANKFFGITQVIGAISMSFMEGAQDGQKYIGFFLLGLFITNGSNQISFSNIPILLIIYCGILLSIGIIDYAIGLVAVYASIVIVLIASIFGIPVSTTHSKGCAIMGVGTSKSLSNVNWNTAKEMILTWIITFPGCGLLAFVITKILLFVF